MFLAEKLRKTNIAEYLLYMWQVEDIIRAYGCDLLRIRREYVSTFHLEGDALDEEETWWHNLVRMMKEEGITQQGHLQINKVTMQLLCELNDLLLNSSKYPFYVAQYYKVLPYIVELRRKAGEVAHGEIETCFDALYGVMMLRLQKKKISEDTQRAVKEITTFIGLLNDYYFKDKEKPLEY